MCETWLNYMWDIFHSYARHEFMSSWVHEFMSSWVHEFMSSWVHECVRQVLHMKQNWSVYDMTHLCMGRQINEMTAIVWVNWFSRRLQYSYATCAQWDIIHMGHCAVLLHNSLCLAKAVEWHISHGLRARYTLRCHMGYIDMSHGIHWYVTWDTLRCHMGSAYVWAEYSVCDIPCDISIYHVSRRLLGGTINWLRRLLWAHWLIFASWAEQSIDSERSSESIDRLILAKAVERNNHLTQTLALSTLIVPLMSPHETRHIHMGFRHDTFIWDITQWDIIQWVLTFE